MVGLGPLESLLEDDSITEIMVNRADEIFIGLYAKSGWKAWGFVTEVLTALVVPLVGKLVYLRKNAPGWNKGAWGDGNESA